MSIIRRFLLGVWLLSLLLSVSCSASSNSDDDLVNTSQFQSNQIICNRETYNCPSYGGKYQEKRLNNCKEVSEVWNKCGSDIHRLDGDDDGRPCEKDCS